MIRSALCVLALCCSCFSYAAPPASQPIAAENSTHPALSSISPLAANHPADRIRVLVALGASTYFLKDGRPHGLEYALLSGFEAELNRGRAKNQPPRRLQFIATEAGELIPALLAGKGDIAAGMLPVLSGAPVSFTDPYVEDEWCLVAGKVGGAKRFDELQDQPLILSPASWGRRLLADQPQLQITDAPIGSSVETLLAELNAGRDGYTVASRSLLSLWSARFKSLQVGECLPARVATAWAVRPQDQDLADDLNRYLNKMTMARAIQLTQRYLPNDAKAARSTALSGSDKLAFFAPMFQSIAAANQLDWMLLAAIGQKETKFNPVIRNNGPTGVMQVNPSTARAMGVKDPHGNEGNITAAAKYLAYLRKMFSQQGITEENQLYFMIAAYNAGEGRLQQIRTRTKAQGLNPNVWIGNVEKTAMNQVSKGMVDYVAAVNRYYLAYQATEKAKRK